MQMLSKGKGELLGWHDPDEHREWVRKNKSLKMEDKTMGLSEAISRYVKDESFLVIGGFGQVRTPMAAIYEIIRQGKKNLTLAGKDACHDFDSLVASGSVSKVEVSYSFAQELRGLAPASRRAAEKGEIKVAAEWSNAAYQTRLKAAASGLPWIPAYSMLGTDEFKVSAAMTVEDPFTKRPICLVPACFPDVAIIHVHRCDIYGNAQIEGILAMDFELARAAKRLIITTEKIISDEEIRKEPWKTVIPYFYVDAVVEVPHGSHPTNMPNLYYFDEEHMAEYMSTTRTPEGTKEYFDKYVRGVRNFEEYLKLVGGDKKLGYLADLEHGEAEFTYPWLKREKR